MIRKLASILFAVAVTATASASVPPEVRARITADTVLIGDRFSIEIAIEKDMMQVIGFPDVAQSLAKGGMEVLYESPLDTVRTEGRQQTLTKTYELTSFTAGSFDLGRFPILYGDKNVTDTLYSAEPLHIVVNTFPVDTDNSTIYDIKAPEETPLLVEEFSGYVMWTFMGALLVAAVALLVRRWISSRGRSVREDGTPMPYIPPHVRAIEDLETLHNQKLWQSGRTKAYYTGLTDIVRTYINGRYGVNAMEMTSDEIMRAVAPMPLNEKDRRGLRDILKTADLVKFAKHTPDADENESLYYAAYYFVEDTKELPQEDAEETEEDNGDGSK